jgi:imidazolonepropionase-like amidohydrolase
MNVVIEGGRIRSIGTPAATPLGPYLQIIDGGGKFLIPGLWDMHLHVPANAAHRTA